VSKLIVLNCMPARLAPLRYSMKIEKPYGKSTSRRKEKEYTCCLDVF
jgi:hypothetical protein